MTQPAQAPTSPDAAPPAAAPARSESTAMSRGMRETIESIAIALALAFLFKTFEAEAFVIPTGSMAPTLMGRHKDVACPQCGYRYTASGSDEADHNGYERSDPSYQVVATTCPLCRYTMSVDPHDEQNAARNAKPSHSGDRIWVSKVPYHFSEPRRFDVIVFRYPMEAESYYIKRLVGLPNETLRIFHGDLFVKKPAEEDFEIVRKSPEKILAMAQVVHDNDYVSQELLDRNWPARWQPSPPGAAGGWRASDDTRSYHTDGQAPGDAWIRYEHTVPSEANWRDQKWPPAYKPRPQLITDFYAFNARELRREGRAAPYMLGLHWVGDLILDCTLDIHSDKGQVLFDLVRSGQHFGCTVDVATGRAQLSIERISDWQPAAQTAIRGPGKHHVMFANADRQLLLWVDGRLVSFDKPTTYGNGGKDRPEASDADPGDLAPAGIGTRGAALTVDHLRVLRDIYYIADTATARNDPISDYNTFNIVPEFSRAELAEFLASPEMWQKRDGENLFDGRHEATFTLGPDQFFVLGDNSPASSDARLWSGQQYVDRELLVGKALFVYWPHPLPLFIPYTDKAINVIPDVERMHFIR